MRPQPADWPKGYSWADWTENDHILGEKSIGEFWNYVKRSVISKNPRDIIAELMTIMEDKESRIPDHIRYLIRYIIDNEDIHKYLVEVGDGSFRTNRILIRPYSGLESIFHSYDDQRFRERLRNGNIKISKYEDNKNPQHLIELLNEVIEKDEVIFIQFDYSTDEDHEYVRGL